MNEEMKDKGPFNKDPNMNRLLLMYDAIVGGMPKSKMRRKYDNGEFGKPSDFDEDYREVIKMYANDIEQLADDERAKLYGRFLAVYRMAYEQGRLGEAVAILNSMARLTVMKENKVSLESANGNVTISFGFNNNSDGD